MAIFNCYVNVHQRVTVFSLNMAGGCKLKSLGFMGIIVDHPLFLFVENSGSYIGGFLKWGYPPNHPVLRPFEYQNPAVFLGSPMT